MLTFFKGCTLLTTPDMIKTMFNSRLSWFIIRSSNNESTYGFVEKSKEMYKGPVYQIKYRFRNKTRVMKFEPRTLCNPKKMSYWVGMDEKNYIKLEFYNYTYTIIRWSGPLINRDLALRLGLEKWN